MPPLKIFKALKKILLSALFFASVFTKVSAQVQSFGNVGIGVTTPQPDAILDVESSTGDRGLLIPRLTSLQMDSIFLHHGQVSHGLMFYNKEEGVFYYNALPANSQPTSPPVWQTFPFKKCPTNFVAVGQEFCIFNNPQSAATWETAAAACQSIPGNAHLCSWAEWLTACQTVSATIFTGMTTGGGEWVDDATSATDALFVGNGTCPARGEAATSTQKQYRCCYRK